VNRPEYNDTDVPFDQAIYDRLLENGTCAIVTNSATRLMCAGIDSHLSKHVAHLFIRDPIVIFAELLDQDDEQSMDHFEVRYTARSPARAELSTACTEHTVDELADGALQAAAGQLAHWLARRVSQHGGTVDRL
jgi:hypothetical protein